ncbi:hypothetical protein EIN_062680 [Entamoeba invadens IP1]|uniref:hypothetical protein n=1 Tax=Entamoeba invadens IP1 TaxID=370355 RepID=UPI0002C3D441|nr:hypothetical protein EIN_062680 [Entamoeba invadens IP1]ELP93573.1 hypothetical protein EIN_062680 [Entamoeba invadens IP1]|eukprot:XP_004260344.1 hypothetical protein EIN_062680 [Entamoeba invadens IP1]
MNKLVFEAVLLGEDGVGKKNIIDRYVYGEFDRIYEPTRRDKFITTLTVESQLIVVEFNKMFFSSYSFLDYYIRKSSVFFLVYSITSIYSFKKIQEMRDMVIQIKCWDNKTGLPIVLCGNKCDLESERKVTTEEGQKLADEFQCAFFETSAKNNTNLDVMFQVVVKDLLNYSKSIKSLNIELTKQKSHNKNIGCLLV